MVAAYGGLCVRSAVRKANQSDPAAPLQPTVTRPESTHPQATVEGANPGGEPQKAALTAVVGDLLGITE